MHRLLTALLAALLLAGLLPVGVMAAIPVVTGAPVTTDEDVPVTITLTSTDVDGDAATGFTITTDPLSGLLGGVGAITCDGLTPNVCTADVQYTPNANANGPDSFAYTATAGGETSDPATVSITVNPVNDKPVCTGPYTGSGNEDTQLGGSVVCTDIDSASLTYSLVAGAASGAAAVAADGTWTYDPNLNFNGSDGFTFKANDGVADSDPAAVALTVIPVNDAPVCGAMSLPRTRPFPTPSPAPTSMATSSRSASPRARRSAR
jgi:hypothetical protein